MFDSFFSNKGLKPPPSLGCLERRELSEPMAKSFKVYMGCLAFPKRKRARYLDFSGANC